MTVPLDQGLGFLGVGAVKGIRATEGVAAKGFKSFPALKKALGAAGKGKAWHHIVEQTPANIKKFGAETIHNAQNVLKLDNGKGSIHAKISGYFSRKLPGATKTVRQMLSSKSFEEQYKFGIKILKEFGGLNE